MTNGAKSNLTLSILMLLTILYGIIHFIFDCKSDFVRDGKTLTERTEEAQNER